MRRFLLLISLLLISAFSSGAYVASTGSATRNISVTEPVEVTSLTDITNASYLFPFNDNETTRYTVAIAFKNSSFSGICVVKQKDDIIVGTIVNEFGIRAFDFTVSLDRKHVKLLNVMKPLDKCLVRKTIARDLRRLFSSSSTDEYVSVEGVKIIMRRPNRRYSFSKMNIPE